MVVIKSPSSMFVLWFHTTMLFHSAHSAQCTVHSGSVKRFCVNACVIVSFDLDFDAFHLLLHRAVLFGFTLAVITRYGFNVKRRDGGRECIFIQF